MTRSDLTEGVYQVTELPHKESDAVVCAIFDSIVRALRSGDKVEIRGFGSFHMRQRRGRIARPKNRSPSRSATEENSLFQTEQGTSRAG
jgi:nucleoid DNA-binding protein